MKKLLSKTRQAINDFDMIQDGDKIAVGLSGGKDSLALLHILNEYRKFSPQKFDLIAITLNPGGVDNSPLYKLCEELNIEFHEIQTDIKEIVFDIRNEKNPCSLCANLRRGILNSTAIREGCNKIALGHNEDDVLETFFLNLLYGGNINTFAPTSYMDRSEITLIRPLIYAPEKSIKAFVKRNNIEIMDKVCPMDGVSKREDIKKMIKDLRVDIPHIRSNLYGAIKRNINEWKKPE
jgi:tRNA(Ile)-lysidine synthase TilS/MesJ